MPDATAPTATAQGTVAPTAEALLYLELLVCMWLIDRRAGAVALERCRELARRAVAVADGALDALIARCWFLYSRAAELVPGALPGIRAELLAAHKSAGLRRMDETRATLLNLLLRGHIAAGLYEQADLLVSKAGLGPDATASNNQLARYHFYLGRIRAVQLDYSGAHDALQ
jgi:26S proteasome regulatory subunit N3